MTTRSGLVSGVGTLIGVCVKLLRGITTIQESYRSPSQWENKKGRSVRFRFLTEKHTNKTLFFGE